MSKLSATHGELTELARRWEREAKSDREEECIGRDEYQVRLMLASELLEALGDD